MTIRTALMLDNIIVTLSAQLIGLWFIDYMDAHHYAIESLWSILSMILFVYLQHKDNNND